MSNKMIVFYSAPHLHKISPIYVPCKVSYICVCVCVWQALECGVGCSDEGLGLIDTRAQVENLLQPGALFVNILGEFNLGVYNLLGQIPQPLLWAGYRAVPVKIPTSSIPDIPSYCAVFLLPLLLLILLPPKQYCPLCMLAPRTILLHF